MSKTLKILLIVLLFLSINIGCNFVFASNEDVTTSSATTTSAPSPTVTTSENKEEVIKENTVNPSDLSNLSPNSGSTVQSIYSYSESNLHLNNILSIILISIGVLLILFAIALLIRLSH